MRVAVFNTKTYDRHFLGTANARHGHDLLFLEPRLTLETSALAADFPAVCAFVNDDLSAPVLDKLSESGTHLIALRSAGFNHVDLSTARTLGITVVRVPAYSPNSVAEHAVGLILALNRRLVRASARIREGNFSLEGLIGFDLHGKTVGVIGTGQIGTILTRIVRGFGCAVLAYDPYPNPTCQDLGAIYVPIPELLAQSDIVTLHCPLTPETHHLIDESAVRQMKPGVMLINTSRGALLDTVAIIAALKSGQIGYLGLDVYEEEEHLFFQDLSDRVLQDDVFARLLTFPNVLITGHQAFFTREALTAIAETTLENISTIERGEPCPNAVSDARIVR